MRNTEAQHTHQSTASLCSEREVAQRYPIFMFTISLVQVTIPTLPQQKRNILTEDFRCLDNCLLLSR